MCNFFKPDLDELKKLRIIVLTRLEQVKAAQNNTMCVWYEKSDSKTNSNWKIFGDNVNEDGSKLFRNMLLLSHHIN